MQSVSACPMNETGAHTQPDWLFGYRVTVAVNKHVQGFPSKLSQTVLPLWRISKNK